MVRSPWSGRISGGEDPGSLEFGDAEIMDGRGKLVLPGLFDTHIHGAQQLGRGLGDNMYQRFFTHLWKIESEIDEGDALCAFVSSS